MSDQARQPGTLIDGRYRLVRMLAEGGMGVVWEAEHLALGKPVALKLLHAEVATIPGVSARFEREAKATSRLDHPHVVRVLDFGRTSDGTLFLVLELLSGRSLAALLAERGPLPLEQALGLIDQALAALEVAHAQGLVHRDLKPDNLFITVGSDGREQAKILDFGIAALRSPTERTQLTQAGAVMGTPAYMSPEQAMGRPDLDGRSDLHAIGVLLYELLCGEPPYTGDNYHQILHAILSGAPKPLEQRRPGLPAHVYAAIARAMAQDPAARFPDAAALRAALRGEGAASADGFRLPSTLATTGLGHDEAPRPVRAPTPSVPIALAQPALDELPVLALDRPAPPVPAEVPPPPSSRRWILGLVAALALGAAALVAPRLRAPANVTIDLAAVPPGARLSLDGTAIGGDRLVLPRSSRERVLLIDSPHRPPRQLRFVADRDQILSLREPGRP